MKKEKGSKQKNHKSGFTLLELLVVVLIIGILAAIALPHYQLVRDQAEFRKYQAMAASLRDAYDDYVLIHGVGTGNFDELSFTLPSDFSRVYGGANSYIQCFQNSDMFCCMSKSTSGISGLINCGKNDLSVIYTMSILGKNNTPGARVPICKAEVGNARANRLCASLGKKGSTSNAWTPEGYDNDYQKYTLK